MARRDPLGVWLYGTRVAELSSSRPGEVVCRYTSEALDRWPLNTPLLSCWLPLSSRRYQAGVFFGGLLPEGQHRQAMAAEARVPTYDTFGLLGRYGKDVAGAAVIAHDDPGDRPGDVVPYDRDELEAEVASLPERPLGLHDDSELSIAGLQDKMLLVDLGGGRWGRPVHGRPSTHILKVEDRRYPGMAEMEAACLRLAKAAGLTTVDVQLDTIGGVACLIVSRFDRRIDAGGGVTRLHQEDACQALGRDPDANRGRGKYERAGGPALREVAGLLDRYGADPVAELLQLVRVVTFIVVTGNADAHGKNLGLLHISPGVVSLAPLYDTVPTVLWPNLRAEAAMAVNGRTRLEAITLDDIAEEARRWTLPADQAREAAVVTAQLLMDAARGQEIPKQLGKAVVARGKALLAT
ncbi:MAG TPA: HipA domain-containing protein [Acidimicrobiales bacterium]|nr:HipA domain-containing protein [Acidimicrobiales bacterium]